MSLQLYLVELHDLAIPLALADAIVVFSVICFNKWSSQAQKMRLTIDRVTQQISALSSVAPHNLMTFSEEQDLDTAVKRCLQETSSSWMTFSSKVPLSERTQTWCSVKPYAEIWQTRKILKTQINLELMEAMPNFLVGFGLMCTFAFLAIALLQTGQALRAVDVSPLQQETALQNLIATAGGKFIVSIAGLLCSLLWNWRFKVMINKFQSSLNALCEVLKKSAPENATQLFMQTQLDLLQEIGAAIRTHMPAHTVSPNTEKMDP